MHFLHSAESRSTLDLPGQGQATNASGRWKFWCDKSPSLAGFRVLLRRRHLAVYVVLVIHPQGGIGRVGAQDLAAVADGALVVRAVV